MKCILICILGFILHSLVSQKQISFLKTIMRDKCPVMLIKQQNAFLLWWTRIFREIHFIGSTKINLFYSNLLRKINDPLCDLQETAFLPQMCKFSEKYFWICVFNFAFFMSTKTNLFYSKSLWKIYDPLCDLQQTAFLLQMLFKFSEKYFLICNFYFILYFHAKK